MEQAQTAEGSTLARKGCQVGWLDNSKISGLVGSLAVAAGNILLNDEVRLSTGAGCEDLQVLHYEEGGQYILHHDSNDRVLTVLYYLNGEGGTWFPLARVGDDVGLHQDGVKNPEPRTRDEALQMAHPCSAGSHGLLLRGRALSTDSKTNNIAEIKAGDAVAFFNYGTDVQTGERKPIWRAIHAGVPAASDKWIANHWFHSGIY